MNTRATFVLSRDLIRKCMGDGEFQENVPVQDVMRVEQTDHFTLLKYRKHETRGLTVLNEETLKEAKKSLFQSDLVYFRSLIFEGDRLVSFTPPKSVNVERIDTPVFEEFVEGTMMTVFYDNKNDTWEMATRTVVGGRNQFYKDTSDKQQRMTFRKMLLDAMTESRLEFEMLDKQYSYTFVVQHPMNRVVIPFHETSLYLVGLYRIENGEDTIRVDEMDLTTCYLPFMKHVKIPQRYEGTLDEIRQTYASESTDYSIVGVVVRDGEKRAKLRNPVYERIRRLRGNQPKQQYQYLILRQEGRVSEFLKHYPEMRKRCSLWRNQIHTFTRQLHTHYINVFVLHKTPIQDISFEYRPHVIALHEKYLHELKDKQEKIHRGVVIAYVNTLPPPRLMFCLNAPIRKQHRDATKAQLTEQPEQPER